MVATWQKKTVAMLAGEIGYVFQNPDDQIFKYHVIDEVMFGPQNIGMTKEQAKEKAVAALKLVGLEQLADENPYDLELSERKLVAIASVLAMDTKVLILDEPTIAQDWKGRKIIQKMIRDLSSQGKTVIAIFTRYGFCGREFRACDRYGARKSARRWHKRGSVCTEGCFGAGKD